MTNSQPTPTDDLRSAPALAIANWWADHAFGGTIGDTGDRSDGAAFTMALAVVAGAQGVRAPADKRAAFVDDLARRVDEQLATRVDRPHFSVTIGVDYGPDPILADAARATGVAAGSFPWKTMTWTYPTHVVASLGYHGKDVLIWHADDWERPVCGAAKYSDAPEYERQPWACSSLLHHEGDHRFDTPVSLCTALVPTHTGASPSPCRRPATDEYHDMSHAWSARHHSFEGRA